VHGSVQAVLQQTALAQNPEAHCELALHVSLKPTWHWPPVSQYVPTQSASVVHVVLHAAVAGSQW